MPNFIIFPLTALLPLVIGFIWYNPKVLGTAWMKAADVSEDKMKGANMPLIFGLTYLLSLAATLIIYTIVVHQVHMNSILMNEVGFGTEGSEIQNFLTDFMAKHGKNFRTFGHGALHGTIAGFLFVTPIMAINAMFERKGFKYIAINAGYWIICLALMGGLICQFA